MPGGQYSDMIQVEINNPELPDNIIRTLSLSIFASLFCHPQEGSNEDSGIKSMTRRYETYTSILQLSCRLASFVLDLIQKLFE